MRIPVAATSAIHQRSFVVVPDIHPNLPDTYACPGRLLGRLAPVSRLRAVPSLNGNRRSTPRRSIDGMNHAAGDGARFTWHRDRTSRENGSGEVLEGTLARIIVRLEAQLLPCSALARKEGERIVAPWRRQ